MLLHPVLAPQGHQRGGRKAQHRLANEAPIDVLKVDNSSVRAQQIEKLRAGGVTTVAQLAALPDDARIPRMAPATLDKLRAQARLQLPRWQGGERYVPLGNYGCFPLHDGGQLLEPVVELPIALARELREAFSGGAVRTEAVKAFDAAIAEVS